MHKFVLEIIYSNYLRDVCLNIHISIFLLRSRLFKMYILNLNCKLTPQSILLFSKCQIGTREKTPRPKPLSWFMPQFARIILCYWSVEIDQLNRLKFGLSFIWRLKQTYLLKKKPELKKTRFVLIHPFSQWNSLNSHIRFLSVYIIDAMKTKWKKMSWIGWGVA